MLDVWLAAVWEAYMGEAPYGGLTKLQIMYGVVTEGLRPHFPPGAPSWYCNLASTCWSRFRHARCGYA